MWNPFGKKPEVKAQVVEPVVEQKPEKKFKQVKEAKIVLADIQKFSLSVYVAKIYNESGKEIGKTCFTDKMQYSAFSDKPTNYDMYSRDYNHSSYGCGTEKPEKCSHAWVSKEEYEKFQNFKNNTETLSFEDYDENTVILSTDIIKRIVISVEDTWEEEVQTYKEIFEYIEVEIEESPEK